MHTEVNNYKCVDQWIIQKVSTPVLQHQVVSAQPCIGKMIMVLAFKRGLWEWLRHWLWWQVKYSKDTMNWPRAEGDYLTLQMKKSVSICVPLLLSVICTVSSWVTEECPAISLLLLLFPMFSWEISWWHLSLLPLFGELFKVVI